MNAFTEKNGGSILGSIDFFILVVGVVILLGWGACRLGDRAGRRDVEKLPPNNRVVGKIHDDDIT